MTGPRSNTARLADVLTTLTRLRDSDVHVADFDGTGYSLMHPMRCRPDLLGCELNQALYDLLPDSPVDEPGQYGVRLRRGDKTVQVTGQWGNDYDPVLDQLNHAIEQVGQIQQAVALPPVPPGPCWAEAPVVWPSGAPRCDLRAGHAGAHECDRGIGQAGRAVWSDDDAAVVADAASERTLTVLYHGPEHEALLGWLRHHGIEPDTIPGGTKVFRDGPGQRIVYREVIDPENRQRMSEPHREAIRKTDGEPLPYPALIAEHLR